MPRVRTYIVGREPGCDVRLDDASISRHHAEVVRASGGRLYVTDRATTNGTFILDGDDWRAIRQAFLEPTGRIRFGHVEMSAGRLDILCPAGEAPPPGREQAGAVPTTEDSPGLQVLVRDPKTGEVLERDPRRRPTGSGSRGG